MAPPKNNSESIRTTVFRVVPARDAAGKRIPNRWNMEECVVSGVVESRKVHERNQTLPVVRERHTLLVQRWANREAPEEWT